MSVLGQSRNPRNSHLAQAQATEKVFNVICDRKTNKHTNKTKTTNKKQRKCCQKKRKKNTWKKNQHCGNCIFNVKDVKVSLKKGYQAAAWTVFRVVAHNSKEPGSLNTHEDGLFLFFPPILLRVACITQLKESWISRGTLVWKT